MEGMKTGLLTSVASITYVRTVGQMANPSPGQGLANPDGTYKPLANGQIPTEYLVSNSNIIGDNQPLTFNADGKLNFWDNFTKQGGFISNTVNMLPGINATGALHDTWWNQETFFGFKFNALTNWGTMLPAAAISYGAMLDSPYTSHARIVDRIWK